MKLKTLRISGFQSFGPGTTAINLSKGATFLIGPNGAGKTAVLQALSRLFDISPGVRRVRRSDFHVPLDEAPDDRPAEREFFIEADFVFPELAEEDGANPSIPPNFAHMRLVSDEGPAMVRFRLDAKMDAAGDIDEDLSYVLTTDADDEPVSKSPVPRPDRNSIQVHYLPARRDPSEHISYTATSLIGRLLRSANWESEAEEVKDFATEISNCLGGNESVTFLSTRLTEAWKRLHKGSFFTDPKITFVDSHIESVLRHLSISFGPGHGEDGIDFTRLSDGQKSMLYLTLVLASHEIGSAVLSGANTSFDIDKLKPAIFTLIAMEEPENSLAPHYLGRITRDLTSFSGKTSAQAIIATHSPSMLKRIPPGSIRYIRLDEERNSVVSRIKMPPKTEEAYKFVREAVQAFPELYFSTLVILGEGDSEEIILPRVLRINGLGPDESAISIVPLGGRHVNHFWRLLNGLGIPYLTLLDLDLARHGGGWGRIKYALKEMLALNPQNWSTSLADISSLPAWNAESTSQSVAKMEEWIKYLETWNVFFSSPLDLDLMMIESFPDAYAVKSTEKTIPSDPQIKAVLGENSHGHDQYSSTQKKLFPAYHKRFKLKSKPAAHIEALAALSDSELKNNMPKVLNRLAVAAADKLKGLPE